MTYLNPKYLLLILFIVLDNFSYSQPVADFDAIIKRGCSPLQVNFINHSSPSSGVSYTWILGNGNSSHLFEPFAIYSSPGSYNVTLIVSEGTNSDTITKYNFITVYQNPVANFFVTGVTSGCAPFNIDIQNISTPGDTAISGWKWDFGDGTISLGNAPFHIYHIAGVFNVSLIVTDLNGCNGSKEIENYVESYKPVSLFSCDPTSTCTGMLTASFMNLSTGEGSLTFLWNFGDTAVSMDTYPVHTYDTPGNYSVSLITTDSAGCKDTLSRINYIRVNDVIAAFTVNKDTLCSNETIYLLNSSVNSTVFQWDFGDGSVSVQNNPNHSYSLPGDYLITLFASKTGECMDTVYQSINIENIKADFSVSSNYACQLPFGVQYTDLSTNAISWEWHFGNYHTSTFQNPNNTIYQLYYYSPYKNIFSDTLYVESIHGCRDTLIVDTSITIIIPRIDVPNISKEGCVPLNVNFYDPCIYESDYDSIVSWNWNFGDGNSAQSPDASNNYIYPGEYMITFTLETALGCSVYAYSHVYSGNPQSPSFTINTTDSICASESVNFINLSENQSLINQYSWDFGDGTFSIDENPVHSFSDTGYADVSLTVYYNGCPASITIFDLLFLKAPYVSFNFAFECNQPFDYTMTGNFLGADSFYWNFGDSSPVDSNLQQVIHTFPNSGDFMTGLTAMNNTTGCSYVTSSNVQVREIIADFSMSSSVGCPGENIIFDGSISQDEYPLSFHIMDWKYRWIIGDYRDTVFSDVPLTYIFPAKGIYPVRLLVMDQNGCSDTITKIVKIYRPQSDFYSDYLFSCMPVDFSFHDLTFSDTTITNWLWNFGDFSTSVDQNPAHQYADFGVYDISLSVTDVLGCTNSVIKNEYIRIIEPDPTFETNDSTLCIGDTVHFSQNSQSYIVSYYWDFGDGTTSVLPAPVHVYTDTGYYTVRFRIIDNHGCDSTGVRSNFIDVQQPPLPYFVADVLNTTCYPAEINFTDQSVSPYLGGWLWTFDDNQTASANQNPSHTYFRPGLYNITLISYSTYGCSDTLTKNSYITIGGPWVEIIAPDTACRGDSVMLIAANKMNVYGLKWDIGNGHTGFTDTVTAVYNEFGNVYPAVLLYADTLHTCDIVIQDSLYIDMVIANFKINNGHNSGCTPFGVFCTNLSQNADYFSWYINDAFSSASPYLNTTFTHPGLYNVNLLIHDDFGCSDSIKKEILVFPLPVVKTSGDTLICRGDEIQLSASGGISYEWHPVTGLNLFNIEKPLAHPDSTLVYTVTVKDSNNCINHSSVLVQVYQVPVITLHDTSVVIGEIVQLNAANNEIHYWQWAPDYAISCTQCPDPDVTPLETTTYTLAVTDTNNCFLNIYNVLVEVLKKYSVDVPDLFTPNGDGLNDVAYVKGWGIEYLIEFRVFNRFGEMVFESNDIRNGWDGTYKGAVQNIETYTYIVSVKAYNDEILSKKGFIKLIR